MIESRVTDTRERKEDEDTRTKYQHAPISKKVKRRRKSGKIGKGVISGIFQVHSDFV